jgi:F-type H+-transporting ATPase subunit b
MPQFDVTTFSSQIFWLLICFIILCVFMATHLAPRLASTLEGRERRLQEDWERAKSLNIEMETLQTESKLRLRKSQEKAHHLIRQMSEKVSASKLARLKTLDEELLAKIRKVRVSMEEDQQIVRNHMTTIVSQIVISAAPRILGQSIPQSQVTPIIEAVLKKQGQT